MDQNFPFQSEKLLSPIEILGLNNRVYHLLKRTGIHFVSDIIVCSEKGILNIRNMGPVQAAAIFFSVSKYLEIPSEILFHEEIYEIALLRSSETVNPLKASITILDLSPSIVHAFTVLGVYRIEDLLNLINKMGLESSDSFQGVTYTEIKKIYRKLDLYLSKTSSIKRPEVVVEKHEVDLKSERRPVPNIPSLIDLGVVLKIVFVNERASKIVRLRANQLLTLEEIASEVGGVTRERIRQIITLMIEKTRNNLSSLSAFYDLFEEKAKILKKKNANDSLSIDSLIYQLKQNSPDSVRISTDVELECLIAILRLLVISDEKWSNGIIYKRWKALAFLACLATPSIIKHEKVDRIIKINKEKNRKMSYKDLAYSILLDAQEPLHWSEIVDRAYNTGRRDSFNSTALYNALMRYPNTFVRVDAGTYALVLWGHSQAEYYPNIIASILRSEKKALSLEAIHHKVDSVRIIKRTTLVMHLNMHPRFYRSKENTYGLRVWLSPREKQTLRTPEWLIEEGDSIKRIEQAAHRGYNVQSIISVDLDKT